jgi:hypothetical protein
MRNLGIFFPVKLIPDQRFAQESQGGLSLVLDLQAFNDDDHESLEDIG